MLSAELNKNNPNTMRVLVALVLFTSLNGCLLLQPAKTDSSHYNIVRINRVNDRDEMTLLGHVYDNKSRSTLANANVGSRSLRSFATTDSTGGYALQIKRSGTFEFTVIAGVRTLLTTKPIEFEKGMIVEIDFYLNEAEEISD